jgi:hypothetical protein
VQLPSARHSVCLRSATTSKAGEHAYTASKLRTVLSARWLSEQADVRTRGARVVAYDPVTREVMHVEPERRVRRRRAGGR